MKRKLLDSALVVFATALFVRLTIAFAPHGFHLPRYLREDSNAVMVISAALALALGLLILIPRIHLPRNLPASFLTPIKIIAAVIGAWMLVAALFFSYGFITGYLHPSQPQAPQVTWDDGKP